MSTAELSEQLTEARCLVDVFTTTANGSTELNVPTGKTIMVDGVRVTYFKRLTKDHSHFSPALLKTLWKNAKQYDIIHIHAWWNLVSVLSAVVALWQRVPVVVSPRGTLSTYSFQHRNKGIKKLAHQLLRRLVLRKCHIHATSQPEASDLQQLIQPLHLFTLPNFVKLPLPQLSFPPNSKQSPLLKLIFYSRIDAKKGLELLLQALPLLRIPYQLTIAGSGDPSYINQLENLTQTLGVREHINWIGFQKEHKFEVLQQHDVMVLPSYNENFGNVVIESLGVGTAVLISQQVGLAPYVEEHQLGWICKLTATSIAEQLERVHIQPKELKRIRQQAPALIYTDFTGSTLTDRYICAYQNCIDFAKLSAS